MAEDSQERRQRKQAEYRSKDKVYAEWAAKRAKAQQYRVREIMDRDGDVVYSLSGPNIGFRTHSIDHVRSFLTREGVEWRAVKFEAFVWPGAPEPHDGDA